MTKKEESRRQENRRFAGNVTLGLVMAGTFVALVALANRYDEAEPLRDVAVIGANVLDTSEVVEAVGLPDTGTFAGLDLVAIEEQLLQHPFVKSAAAWDGGGGRLVLEIEERTPEAVVVLEERPVYLDEQASPLPFRFGVAREDVPVITGCEDPEGPDLIDPDRAREAIDLLATIEAVDPTVHALLGTLERTGSGEYRAILTIDGLPVLFGRPDGVIPRVRKLRTFIDDVLLVDGGSDMRTIDLRWRGQVVVRKRLIARNEPNETADRESERNSPQSRQESGGRSVGSL